MSNNKYNNPVTATLNGILDLFRKKHPIGTLGNEERIDGKTCLVTGASSGLGFAVATQLAQRGGKVIMICRSGIPEKGEEVRRLSSNDQVEMLYVDLSDLGSISSLIEKLRQRDEKIDIAVFNAAMVPDGARRTASGFDEMFLVNYLSKFILVRQLFGFSMNENNDEIQNENYSVFNTNNGAVPRIIFISSEAHRSSPEINWEKFGIYEDYNMSKVISLYGYYKLFLNIFSRELSRRLDNKKNKITIHSICPGPIDSNIARAAPSWSKPLLKIIFKLFFNSPEKAAEPVLYLACSAAVEGQSDIYLHMMQEKEMDVRAVDRELGVELWKRSLSLIQ